MIRFDSWWVLNNDYLINWHAALITPILKNWKKEFILSDPWLLIPESINFEYWKNSDIFNIKWRDYIIKQEIKDDLPYVMEVNSDRKYYFDPYNEWINPNETLNKDIMRVLWDFKIVKLDNLWKVQSLFKLDIKTNNIILQSYDQKISIAFNDFLNIKDNKDLYEIFLDFSKNLWKDWEIFYNKNVNIIKNIDEYKEQILTPKTRKILKSKN